MHCAKNRGNHHRAFLATLALVLVACSESPPPSAPEVLDRTGVMTFVEGEVSILEAGVWSPADIGTRVTTSSTVKTGPQSSCDLQFGSLGSIRLSASTTVKLVDVGLGKKTKAADLELVSGAVAAKVTKLVGDQRFTVRTKTVTAGVRGTHFLVREESGRTNVAVAEGVVALIPPSRDQRWAEAPAVAAGQEARVERAESNPVVTPLSEERRRDLERSRDLSVLETLPPPPPSTPAASLPSSGLAAPILVSPRSGEVIRLTRTSNVELRWRTVDGATGYVVRLSSLRDGVTTLIADWTTPGDSVTASNLEAWAPGTLTWEVQAVRSRLLLEDETSAPSQARILLAK